MSEIEPLYCAEQIKVPPSMPEILKAWTKAVIRENVSQVSNFFYNRRKRNVFFFTIGLTIVFLNKKVQPCIVITLLLFGVYEYGGFIILFPTVT